MVKAKKIEPLHNLVLVTDARPRTRRKKTTSKSRAAVRGTTYIATVVAVGKGTSRHGGEALPLRVKKGDRVAVSGWARFERRGFEVEGQPCILVDPMHVLAKVTE